MMIDSKLKKPGVRRQCQILSISRRGLYYVHKGESEENLAVLRILDAQYLETPFYGERRLLAMFLDLGYKINVKRLRRLMRIVRWQTLYPKKRTTRSDGKAYKYPYLLGDLKAECRNQAWAIDITYIPMAHGYMYLFAVIDLYSRYVTGWGLSNSMTSEWCVGVLQEAIARYGKPEIINSDQGTQFTADKYIDFLTSNGIEISMDGKGRALDNVFIERFWRSIKQEYVYLSPCETGKELWQGLNEYINFYNTKRPHQSLAYATPSAIYLPETKTA
jgi:putative transposase